MLEVLKSLIHDENGQAMVEYGLLIGALAVGAILFILTLRYSVETLVYGVTTQISKEINDLLLILNKK